MPVWDIRPLAVPVHGWAKAKLRASEPVQDFAARRAGSAWACQKAWALATAAGLPSGKPRAKGSVKVLASRWARELGWVKERASALE